VAAARNQSRQRLDAGVCVWWIWVRAVVEQCEGEQRRDQLRRVFGVITLDSVAVTVVLLDPWYTIP
jgi:hypothetical protein